MKAVLLCIIMASLAFGDKPLPVTGKRGGCYIVVISKSGKQYKKYVPADQCRGKK